MASFFFVLLLLTIQCIAWCHTYPLPQQTLPSAGTQEPGAHLTSGHSRVIPLESSTQAAAGPASNLITQPHTSPQAPTMPAPSQSPPNIKMHEVPLIKLPNRLAATFDPEAGLPAPKCSVCFLQATLP